MLVDTGLARDTARKILRHIAGLKVQLTAVGHTQTTVNACLALLQRAGRTSVGVEHNRLVLEAGGWKLETGGWRLAAIRY